MHIQFDPRAQAQREQRAMRNLVVTPRASFLARILRLLGGL